MSTAALRRLSVLGLSVVCVVAVAACSNTKKEDQAYKRSKALPSLEVPPDLILRGWWEQARTLEEE